MQLTKNFSLEELIFSSTAIRKGIDNTPNASTLEELKETAELAQRIRDHLSAVAGKDIPLRITSGYRCLALNREMKSSDTSDHIKGLAIDFQAPTFGTPKEIALELAKVMQELGIGQIIHEFSSWVHASRGTPAKLTNRIITINSNGTFLGIV